MNKTKQPNNYSKHYSKWKIWKLFLKTIMQQINDFWPSFRHKIYVTLDYVLFTLCKLNFISNITCLEKIGYYAARKYTNGNQYYFFLVEKQTTLTWKFNEIYLYIQYIKYVISIWNLLNVVRQSLHTYMKDEWLWLK